MNETLYDEWGNVVGQYAPENGMVYDTWGNALGRIDEYGLVYSNSNWAIPIAQLSYPERCVRRYDNLGGIPMATVDDRGERSFDVHGNIINDVRNNLDKTACAAAFVCLFK